MTFEELQSQIINLKTLPNVDNFVFGYSTLGQEILGFHLGSYEGNQIIIEAGIHAREYPSTMVVIGIIEFLSTQNIMNGGIYIIPLVNPDGVRLVLDGVSWLKCPQQQEYIKMINEGSEDFSLWKANIWAVDLNVNFDALWGGGSQNIFCPSPGNFVGYYPDSEREVRNLIEFSYRIRPALTLSFHTKGEVIYYGFETLTPEQIERDRMIANEISNINGYLPIKTENSTGGYSDWISEYLEVPAFTIEIGPASEPTPIPLDQVPIAVEKNKNVPLKMLEIVNKENEDVL